jgi:hypothetical protein
MLPACSDTAADGMWQTTISTQRGLVLTWLSARHRKKVTARQALRRPVLHAEVEAAATVATGVTLHRRIPPIHPMAAVAAVAAAAADVAVEDPVGR